jgi:hypothetical protein
MYFISIRFSTINHEITLSVFLLTPSKCIWCDPPLITNSPACALCAQGCFMPYKDYLLMLVEWFLYITIACWSYESKNKSVTKANEGVRRNTDRVISWLIVLNRIEIKYICTCNWSYLAVIKGQSRETGKTKKNKTKTQHNMCWAPLCAKTQIT